MPNRRRASDSSDDCHPSTRIGGSVVKRSWNSNKLHRVPGVKRENLSADYRGNSWMGAHNRLVLSWQQICPYQCDTERRMIDDRIIGPYFTLDRRHEQLLLHFYWADYKYVPAGWKRRVGRRYPRGGRGERRRSGDRGGADKTTVLCKPRYQCGVNRALTPSAGNQPLPLLPSTSWVFAGLLLERACHAPVWGG